jgi:rod shape-determining protein MreB and related proteins
LIGEKTAEEIKLALGSVTETDKDYLEISGRSMENGMPKSINVKKKLLFEPLYPYYGQIIDLVREAVEETPPELIKDINSKGIILSGMSSGFLDLDTYFTRELRISVKKVSEPEYTVIRGLGFLIEHKDILEKIAVHFAKI